MKKYISEYMASVKKFIADDLSSADRETTLKVLKELETKILFFQHERLIHLIVTVLFAIMEIMSILGMFLITSIVPLVLACMFLILLVPYVMHYYFLENSVHEMYKLRDKINESLS